MIVALYPVVPEATPRDEDPLTRLLVAVILISGFAVAALGLVQQVTWNGKLVGSLFRSIGVCRIRGARACWALSSIPTTLRLIWR